MPLRTPISGLEISSRWYRSQLTWSDLSNYLSGWYIVGIHRRVYSPDPYLLARTCSWRLFTLPCSGPHSGNALDLACRAGSVPFSNLINSIRICSNYLALANGKNEGLDSSLASCPNNILQPDRVLITPHPVAVCLSRVLNRERHSSLLPSFLLLCNQILE